MFYICVVIELNKCQTKFNSIEKDMNVRLLKGCMAAALALFLMSTNVVKAVPLNQPSSDGVDNIMQAMTVSGVVKDASGEPVIGANVVVEGTTNGVITDLDGRFTLQNVPSNARIQISYIGYVTQTVNARPSLSITLKEDTETLEEVVVVGYGTQKKVNLTGSVASMNMQETMKSRTVTNLSNALAGMMAGVTALQSTGAPGEDGATIRVRGLGTLNSSAPLIIIDGVEGSMDAVNPQDVESISVLKDAASSAIYGARAANGVVLITTKKGTRGQINVNYNGHVSFLSPAGSYNYVTNYADYMELMNESATNTGLNPYFAQATIDAWRNAEKNPNGLAESGYPNYIAYPNTDWEDYLFGTNVLNEHNVSINGGGEKMRFMASAGYQDNPGIVDNTGQKRYTLRANMDANVTDWLTVGMNTFASQQDREITQWSSANTYLMATNPGTAIYYDGYYGTSAANEENAQDNNLRFILDGGKGFNRISRFNTTLFTKIKFLKHFQWDFNFNYSRRIDERRTWSDGEREKMNFRTGQVTVQKTSLDQMGISTYNYGNYARTIQNLLHYDQSFGKHDVSALAGYEEYYYREDDVSTSKKGLPDYTLTVPSVAAEMVSTTGSASDTSTRSFFGRVNYAYASKYLFEANIRYDGSSRFHKDHRWGVFPSFSAAWRISEEEFMKDGFFDNLKLRASWGKLGNSSIGEYLYQSTYANTNYAIGNANVNGLATTSIANSLLQWESTATTNIGIDASMLNNHLDITLDFYHKFTDGILYRPTIYMTAGSKTAPYKNIAEVTNKGVELSATWRDQKGDFRYSISGNITYNHNEVSKYKGELVQGWETNADGTKVYKSNIGDVSTGGNTRVLEGHQINEYYLLTPYKGNQQYFNADGSVNIEGGPKDGMIRTEEDMDWVKAMIAAGYKFMPNQTVAKGKLYYGDYIFADNNGDGIYGNSYDNKFQGKSSRPPVFYGLQFSLGYKNFDLSGTFTGTLGNKLYWSPGLSHNVQCRLGYEIASEVANDHYFYDPENPTDPRTNLTASYGRLVGESGYQANQASTVDLWNANYLKMKNLTLGYTFPTSWVNKIYMKSLRLYLNAENLFTLTNYPGMDPELGSGYVYMTSRSISIGANITF